MPGKGGISPVQKSFSVPVEMAEWEISTTTSFVSGALSVRVSNDRSRGPCKMTARVCNSLSLNRFIPPEGVRITYMSV